MPDHEPNPELEHSPETRELLRKAQALTAESASRTGHEADAFESLAVSAMACAHIADHGEGGGGLSDTHYATFALMEASVHATLHLAHMVEHLSDIVDGKR